MAVQYAVRLALVAFAVACVQGLRSGADLEGALRSAFLSGACLAPVGAACGALARRVVEEHVRTVRRSGSPLPS